MLKLHRDYFVEVGGGNYDLGRGIFNAKSYLQAYKGGMLEARFTT